MKFTSTVYPATEGARAVLVAIPNASWPMVRELLDTSALKHSGYLTVDLSLPHKPRSTGPLSANNHAWGHATQIAKELDQGDDPRDVLYDACIATPGYPTRMNRFGRVVAKTWSKASTIEAASVIETLHRIAAEFSIQLIEGEDK